MASAVSTMKPADQTVGKTRDGSVALGALHSALQPGLRVDICGRVHALGRIAYDVNDLRPPLRFVEAVGAIGDVRDALVALADRQADRGAWSLEFQTFEGGDHLVGRWPCAALLGLRLFPGRLETQQ